MTNAPDLRAKDVTILAGATGLSDVIDIGVGYEPVGIEMPATWVAADITFLGGMTSAVTKSLQDTAGNEMKVTAPVANKIVPILKDLNFECIRFIQLRSGTIGTPVNQTATRVLKLMVKSK